jgi:ribosomal protein S18 acetylase RimI-like enzyme
LTQKSNKKGQGFGKMAKNYFVSLNPANSPPDSLQLLNTAGSNNAGFLTAYSIIFLTPFFRGRVRLYLEIGFYFRQSSIQFMSAAISIREINSTDASLLSAIALKAYCDHYLHLWFDNGEWYKKRCFTKEVLEQELADANNLFYIAYGGDEPAGFLKVRINAVLETAPEKNGLELERIYLTKASCGKGIGKQLMELSFTIAHQYQKEIIWLKAMDSSAGPIAFYRQMGFEICGTSRLSFEEMKEEYRGMVIMKKDLR